MIAADLIPAWAAAATPPPAFTVSEWAEAHRLLPESSGSQGARWRNALAPYLVGVMDVVHEPGVRRIAIRKAAQIGGSEVLHNVLAYFIAYDPCPMLFVHPTIGQAEEWSKERLADVIRSTPAVAAVIRERRASRHMRADGSTLSLKLFPGGFLAIGGAQTPNTFARRAVRVAFGDDVDRWDAVVGDEGDPADLLSKRTTTFDDPLEILVSTPTLRGGRIDTLYERSDRRRYHVACPQCGREDWIGWNDPSHFRVGFDDRNGATARLECPDSEHGGCGARLDEPARRRMVAAGVWRPTAEPQEPGLVGFHLPAMITTLGQASLSKWVDDWDAARAKGKESLRVFINTTLAEGWEDRGARMEPHALMGRREDYGEAEVPAWAVALTAGVDVQVDRFEIQVQAWGAANERAVVDRRAVPGNPKHAETRAALIEALKREYAHASGHNLPIHATCIDSGYATEEVYDFVLAHQARRIFATKGYAGRSGEPIVGRVSEKRSGRSARPVRLYPVNVDDAKADIMAGLALAVPGPGYLHLPIADWWDEEACAQLVSEHRETRYNKAGVATHAVWVQDRERNEMLDCAVLCLAAFRLLNPNIQQMRDRLALPPRPAGAAPAPASPPPPRAPGWLGPKRDNWFGGR